MGWICSPSLFHADQIKACAAAGKHVFCEKPIATDILETIEAINACNEAGVKLMTALQRRFDPNFARIKRALDNGEVGEPILIKLCSRDPEPPPFEYVKGGGGIFCDMAIHDLDMARFLMDSEPCSGEDGLIALVMATAAGISSTEKRWVKFSEVSKDLCRLSSELPFDLDECELAIEEDSSGGGVDLKKLVQMITSGRGGAEYTNRVAEKEE